MAHDSDPNDMPTPKDANDAQPAPDRLENKPLPMSERELRVVVREIVTEVLEDANERRSAHRSSMLGGLIGDITATDFDLTPKRLALGAIAVVVFVVIPLFIVLRPRPIELPDAVFGSWVTSEERYTDRGFRLTDSTLTLYTGNQDSIVHDVLRVVGGGEDVLGLLRYTIYHTAYGTEYEFSFHYDQADTTIQFVNQPEMTWTKESI